MSYRVLFRTGAHAVDVVVATLQTLDEALVFAAAIADFEPRIEGVEATLHTLIPQSVAARTREAVPQRLGGMAML